MTRKSATTRATSLLAVGWLLAASPAASTTDDIGPWIATMEVHFVPASALVVGANFDPGQSLHLTVADPDGNTMMTMSFAADAEGEVSEYVPVDLPGFHTAEIRDDGGNLLSTTPIFVATF